MPHQHGPKIGILHPLATLQWEECGTLPERISDAECVSLGEKIYVISFPAYGSTKLFESSTDLKSWRELTIPPTNNCALTTYRTQLVLVGGWEISTARVTNKLWTSDKGINWEPSLPPMPTARRWLSAVNTAELLVVAGGVGIDYKGTDKVEVLSIEKQWITVQSLPKPGRIYDSTIHNGKLYLNAVRILYQCDLQSLRDSCQQKSGTTSKLWSEVVRPHYFEEAVKGDNHHGLASFGQQLISLAYKKLVAYFPLTQYVVHVADSPNNNPYVCITSHPTGDLVAIVKGNYNGIPSTCVFRASLTVSSYNPDDQFSMRSLCGLEETGIKIVTSLANNFRQLESVTGIALTEGEKRYKKTGREYSKIERLDVFVGRWKAKQTYLYPPTWRSLLENVLQLMNLNNLSQQIQDYLSTHGREQEYLDAYRQIIATHECIQMWFFRVILLGAPRLGKTTMRRRLTGEIDDITSSQEAEQPSTGAVESGHSVVIRNLSSTTALMTPSEWSATKDLTDEVRMFLQYFHSIIRQKNTMLSTQNITERVKSSVPAAAVDIQESQKAISKPEILSHSTSSVPTATETDPESLAPEFKSSNKLQIKFEIPDMIRNAVSPECWKEIKKLCKDTTAFINIEDTGGQPEFMDMLPALTIGPALYLLFCKLTDELQSHYKVSYLSPSGESTIPRESIYTVEEVFFKALASITCFKSFTGPSVINTEETTSSTVDQLIASCNKSIAYIVGTHKDKVTEQEIDEFDKKLQHSIRSTTFFEEDIVQFSSEERMVLPIDNKNGGGMEIQEVRNFLEEGLKKHFKKLCVPASWFVLSLCLRKREERTASLESVKQVAGELGIPQREIMIALWFLHHYAGVLMYFPDLPELKDTVICNNQVVYDSATNLIVNTFKFGSVGKAASERFRKTGQFSLEDIRDATASISGDYIPLQKLVRLLEHINVIASFIQPISTSIATHVQIPDLIVKFVMPSVLQNATQEELKKLWNSISKQHSLAPLFIRYKCGFVPIGVFPAMIANLAGNKLLEMKVEGIKKNRVEFRIISGDYDMFTLVSQPKYYAVHITRRQSAKTPSHKVCATVRGLVESTLKTVASKMNYKFTADYQLSFECPSHPGREHLCVVNSEDLSPRVMRCLGNMDDPVPVDMRLSQHLVWFGKCSSDASTEINSGLSLHQSSPTTALLNVLKWQDEQGQGQIFRLVNKVSSKWQNFGLSLGLSMNQLDAWHAQYNGDASKCWNRVMDHWLTTGGTRNYPTTWGGVFTLLQDLEFANVARDMKIAVVKRSSLKTTHSVTKFSIFNAHGYVVVFLIVLVFIAIGIKYFF